MAGMEVREKGTTSRLYVVLQLANFASLYLAHLFVPKKAASKNVASLPVFFLRSWGGVASTAHLVKAAWSSIHELGGGGWRRGSRG